MISARTKAALAQAKLRGVRLGGPNLAAARLAAAHTNRTPPPAEVIEFIRKLRDRGDTFKAITAQLNDLNIKTGRGSIWYETSVRLLLLQQPPATREDVADQQPTGTQNSYA
jgi:DNA invertase Pin-like site-specific DNA recombinase